MIHGGVANPAPTCRFNNNGVDLSPIKTKLKYIYIWLYIYMIIYIYDYIYMCVYNVPYRFPKWWNSQWENDKSSTQQMLLFTEDGHMRCFPCWRVENHHPICEVKNNRKNWNHQLAGVGKCPNFSHHPTLGGYPVQKIPEWCLTLFNPKKGTFTNLLVMDSHGTYVILDQAADPPFCKVLGSPASMTWAKRPSVPTQARQVRGSPPACPRHSNLVGDLNLLFLRTSAPDLGQTSVLDSVWSFPRLLGDFQPPKSEVQEDGKHKLENQTENSMTTWPCCVICPKKTPNPPQSRSRWFLKSKSW